MPDFVQDLRRRRLTLGLPQFGVDVPPFDVPEEQFPSMAEYRKYLMTMPQREEFEPGKLRRVLAAIAGGLAGAGKGPEFGAEVGKAAAYGPYIRKMEQYQAGLAPRKEAAETEMALAGERRRADLEQAQAEHFRAETEKLKKPSTYRLRPGEVIKSETGSTLLEGGPVSQRPITHYEPSSGELIVYEPGKGVSTINAGTPRPTRPGTPFAEILERTESRLGRKLTDQEVTELQRNIPSPLIEELRALTAAQKGTEIARIQEESSPESIRIWVGMMHENPEIYHEIDDPKIKPKVARLWREETGLPPPEKLTTEAKTIERVSRVSLSHAKAVRDILKDPQVRRFIGPLMGRIGKGEQFVGGDLRNIPPELQRKAQELRTRLTYLVFQEGRAVLQGRPAVTLINYLRSASPDPRLSLPFLEGALDAVEGVSQINLDTVEELRFGGKKRKKYSSQNPFMPGER